MADFFTDESAVRIEAGIADNSNIDDDTRVTPAVEAANAELFNAVSTRYTTPLSDQTGYEGSMTEKFLKKLATQLGACYVNRALYPGQGGDIAESIESICESAEDKLEQIRTGERKLILDDGNEIPVRDGANNAPSGFPLNTDLEDSASPTNIPSFSTQDVF